MNSNLSFSVIFLQASILVQIIAGILIFFSLISWVIIISKNFSLMFLKNNNKILLQQFNNAIRTKDALHLYNVLTLKKERSVNEAIFYNTISSWKQIKGKNFSLEILQTLLERVIVSTVDQESEKNQKGLGVLATFGSVSPYIGLLGTVIGIMHAFINLNYNSSLTLTAVAPGIAEALIATAIGLFVAIPAYIFYNKFITQTKSLENSMYSFGDLLLNTILSDELIFNVNNPNNLTQN